MRKKKPTWQSNNPSYLPASPGLSPIKCLLEEDRFYYHSFSMICFIFNKCCYHAPHGTFTGHHKPTWISTTCPIQWVTHCLHIFDAVCLWQTSRDEAAIEKNLTIISFPAPKPHKIGRVVLKGEAVVSHADISIEDTLSFSKCWLKAEGFLWPVLLAHASHQ